MEPWGMHFTVHATTATVRKDSHPDFDFWTLFAGPGGECQKPKMGVSANRGTLFYGPYNKDPTI